MRFIPENQSVQRKNTSQIIERIYKALEDRKYHTISEISRLAKSNWTTIKNQVDLIVKIQELPKLKIINASKQVLVKKQ
ncbi:MAG: hypothetical protein ACFFDN_02285 [Candidatus Hodarchaeota archaeon]